MTTWDFDTQREFAEWARTSDDPLFEVCAGIGPSPGGAAAELEVSRQRVHQMIKEGKLDAVFVWEAGRDSQATQIYVTDQSIRRVKRARDGADQ